MAKRRTITLTQEPDDTFRVKSWSNSAELSVGMIISRARLKKWMDMPGVEIRVPGMTPPSEDTRQLDLFDQVQQEVKQQKVKKAVIASK